MILTIFLFFCSRFRSDFQPRKDHQAQHYLRAVPVNYQADSWRHARPVARPDQLLAQLTNAQEEQDQRVEEAWSDLVPLYQIARAKYPSDNQSFLQDAHG